MPAARIGSWGVRATRSLLRIGVGTVAGMFLAAALTAAICMSTGCVSGMFYYPDRTDYGLPSDLGLEFTEVTFASRDGTRLTGWFVPAAGGPARGTVVHFHGNAQNMTAHFGFVDWLPKRGFNVFVFDYRGYGRSAGRPDRRGVYEDGAAALAHVRARPDVDPRRIVVLGQSLGAATAVAILGREGTQGVRAVAVDSAFYSYRSIVKDKIARMPLLSWFRTPLSRLVIDDEFSAGPVVGRIAPVPMLFLHGSEDPVIPAAHSQRLFREAGEPKSLLILEGAGHTEALAAPGPMRERLVDFFTRALADAHP